MRYHRINGEWVQVPEQKFTLGQRLMQEAHYLNTAEALKPLTPKQRERAHKKLEELQELIK